jgi:hypothetical protein
LLAQVRERLVATPADELAFIAADRPAYRCDRLFELGADLADVLWAYALPEGDPQRAEEAAVRAATLDVVTEAVKLWAATCGGPAAGDDGAWAWPEGPPP